MISLTSFRSYLFIRKEGETSLSVSLSVCLSLSLCLSHHHLTPAKRVNSECVKEKGWSADLVTSLPCNPSKTELVRFVPACSLLST